MCFLCIPLLSLALGGCLTTSTTPGGSGGSGVFSGPSVTPFPEAKKTASNARLRVVSREGVVRAMAQKACLDDSASDTNVILGGKGDLQGQSRSMPEPERIGDNPFAELYITAGKPFVLSFQVGPESRARCALAGSFIPQEGKDYEAYATMSEGKCALTVRIRNLASGLWKPERLTPAKNCKKDVKK
jgi:hypothetical protein